MKICKRGEGKQKNKVVTSAVPQERKKDKGPESKDFPLLPF
jgi:hypothetical protein